MKYIAVITMSFLGLFLSLSTQADGSKVVLGGYCSVAYVAANKALYGDPKYQSDHEGKTYYFINGDAKQVFDKEPSKFAKAIKYDGYCATGVALGKKLLTDPTLFSNVDGKVYLFSSKDAKDAFDKDSKGMAAKAEANWPQLK